MKNLALQLKKIYPGDDFIDDESGLMAYSYDNSRIICQPDFAVFAQTSTQIQQTVMACIEHKTPVVARGRGTATTGASLAKKGGVVVSCERMNKIIKIDADNRFAIVEPGVNNLALQKACAEHGLFWGPNPTSSGFSSIGGNLACNASGSRSLKYGAARDNVLALKFINGEGKLISSGKPVSKISAGFDMARFLVGSEGTCGIITEATLKLTPLPQTRKTIRIIYQDIMSAAQAVANIMRQPYIPAAMEFLDKNCILLIKDQLPELSDAGAILIIEIDGGQEITATEHKIKSAATNPGMIDFSVAANAEDEEKLWQARKVLSPKLREIAPKKINEDVVVPVAHIPQLLSKLDELATSYQLPIVSFGHIGNGNLHVNLLIDPEDQRQAEQAHICLRDIFKQVSQLDGSISGEHGIGLVKQEFLTIEHDQDSRDMMAKIQQAFDPHGIFNPGKGFAGV